MPISTTRGPARLKGSANTMRASGRQPSIYTLTDAIRKMPTPTLIICGDEDDNASSQLFLRSIFLQPAFDISEGWPRAQSRGARTVQ